MTQGKALAALHSENERLGLYADAYAQPNSENKTMDKKVDDLQVDGSHYTEMAIQPWELMESVLTTEEFTGFLKGNIIKYSLRAGHKDGSNDVGKARHYMMKLKEINDTTKQAPI